MEIVGAKKSNRQMGIKLLAVLSALLVAVSILPLVLISFDNRPYYDDYSAGGRLTKQLVLQSAPPIQWLLTGLEQAIASYRTWEGNFLTNFLNAYQLAGVDIRLCFIITLFLIFISVLSWGMLCKAIVYDVLKGTVPLWILMTSVMVFISIQFIPNANEAFFWQSGGIKYTLGHALVVWLATGCVKSEARLADGKKMRRFSVFVLWVIAFLCPGSNLMSGLGALVGLGLYAFFCLVKHRGRKGNGVMYGASAGCALGMVCNVLAPGNDVRQGVVVLVDPFRTVGEALIVTMEYIGRWISLPWLACMLLLVPFLWTAARRSRFSFRHPLWFLAGSFAALAAQLAPPIYSGVYVHTGRILNTMYLSFCLWSLLNVFYNVGFVARCAEEGRFSVRVSDGFAPDKKGIPIAFVAALSLALIVGCAGYGLTRMTSGAAAKSLLTGESKQYRVAYDQRAALLEAPEEGPLQVLPIKNIPLVFMQEEYSFDAMLKEMQTFYEKVILDGREGQIP